MLADFFRESLQGALFTKFREVIMVLKHIYNLKMGLTSTEESVGNVVKIGSNKEVIKSNVETEGEDT